MTDTQKVDPWALLREARGSVLKHKERLLDCDHEDDCTCDLAAQKIVLLDRIDTALAEHADSATPVVESEPVKWRRTQKGSTFFVAHLNDADMALRVDWDRWYWKVTREGHTNTLDEAKSAAIAAARGIN